MTKRDEKPHVRDEFIRKGLRFTQLRLLAALQDSGQISGAAAQLAITQPAASRLLSELEQMTGTALCVRHAKGITLTEAGLAFAARAHAILRQLNDTRDVISEMARGMRGQVRLGAVTGPALEVVLPVIRELRELYPEIEIAVDVDTSDKLAEALLSRRLDFYIGRLPDGIDARAVRMRCVGPEPIGLLVGQGHPLLEAERVTLWDCLDQDWIMQPQGGLMRRTVETYLLEHGYPLPARILGTSSLLLTLALIGDGRSIAPLARSVGEFYAARGGPAGGIRLLDLPDRIAVTPYSIVQPVASELSPSAKRVLALVERKVREGEAPRLAESA